MSITAPKPHARLGTYSPRVKAQASAVLDARYDRARTRFQIAKFAAALRATGASYRAIAENIRLAVEAGAFPPGADYTHERLRALIDTWESGKQSLEDYLEAPRSGRPGVVDPRLRDLVATAVKTDRYGSIRRMHAALAEEAERLGVPTPSYDALKRLVRAQGRTARTAASFGARVAQLEAFPHSTVPARWSHDVWVLDEMDAPFYAKVWDPDVELWVSVRPTVIVLVDHRSGACVAAHVVDPSRRRDPDTGRIMRAGFDAADVLATLLSAAIRDLATPGTERFAGYLPNTLRWDNHKVHQSLRPILTTLGQRLQMQVGSFFDAAEDLPLTDFRDWQEMPVDEVVPLLASEGAPASASSTTDPVLPRLPMYRPINRGKIENKVGFLKLLCREFATHVDRVVPTDRLDADPKWQRDVAAGAGDRTYRREPIDPRRLPSIEECRSLLDGRIAYHNLRHESRMTGATRAALYAQHRTHRPRKGTDLLAALETRTTFVSADGIVHHHDGRQTVFAYAVPGKFILPLDTEVTYKADPLLRGIFAYVEGKHYLLPPKDVWSGAPGRAEEVARTAAANARFHAAAAISARERSFDDQFGPGASKADQARAKAALEEQARAARQAAKQDNARQRAPGTPAPAASPASPDTPRPAPTLVLVPSFRSRVDRLKRREDTPEAPPSAPTDRKNA